MRGLPPRALLTLTLFLLATPAAHATALNVALDISGQGLAMAEGGVGLEGTGTDSRELTVEIGGPVQAALLYWAGRDMPCPTSGGNCVIPSQPYRDQVLTFNGTLTTGSLVGSEQQPVTGGGPVNNIGYFADVTSIVQGQSADPGTKTFTVADGDAGSNLATLDGASLLVLYRETGNTTTYRVTVFDGLDYADAADPTPGPTRLTAPVEFQTSSSLSSREAQLFLFAGDGGAGSGDRLTVSGNPDRVDCLDASDGASWDSDMHRVVVPRVTGSRTVSLQSDGSSPPADSFLWEVAALRVPLAPGGSAVNDPCPGASTAPGEPGPGSPTEPGAGASDRDPPVLAGLILDETRFRARRSGASVAARGTRVSYALSEPSTVTFAVQRRKRGRRVRGRCVRPNRRNRTRPRCARFVTRGRFTHDGVSGANSFRFTGRVNGRALRPGRYRLRAVAQDTAGNVSRPAHAAFRIVR